MTDNTIRALVYIVIAALAGIVLCVAFAAIANAAQCGCPAPTEPPVVVQPLPPVEPGGGYVWLAWVGR